MKFANFYAHKKVLVTGGCGFIGSHLVEKLVHVGAHVTILDNLETGYLAHISAVKDHVILIQKSIADKAACLDAVAGNEIIFHLAAFTSVPGSVKDPVLCHTTNVDGTFNLLDAARTYQVSRFVFSSSSSVYGPREDACFETDTHLNPISPYGATKLIGELYCTQFNNLFNVPAVMLRYFNVYGPRQDPNSQYAAVVAKFTDAIQQNKPVTIFGDGTQTRDFIPVADVVEANLLAGMAPQEQVSGQIFNVASGRSLSVLELFASLRKQFPWYAHEPIFMPARDGDVPHTLANCEKLYGLLGHKKPQRPTILMGQYSAEEKYSDAF